MHSVAYDELLISTPGARTVSVDGNYEHGETNHQQTRGNRCLRPNEK